MADGRWQTEGRRQNDGWVEDEASSPESALCLTAAAICHLPSVICHLSSAIWLPLHQVVVSSLLCGERLTRQRQTRRRHARGSSRLPGWLSASASNRARPELGAAHPRSEDGPRWRPPSQSQI